MCLDLFSEDAPCGSMGMVAISAPLNHHGRLQIDQRVP